MRDSRAARALAMLASLAALAGALPARARPTMADVDAAARAGGNRRAVAVGIGRRIFTKQWPAQVTKIRVDGIGRHEVALVTLSAVKFKSRLSVRGFEAEVAAIERIAFAASDVEEIDLQAVEPISLQGTPVISGDLAVPTFRVVYAETALRSATASRTAASTIYISPAFARRLGA